MREGCRESCQAVQLGDLTGVAAPAPIKEAAYMCVLGWGGYLVEEGGVGGGELHEDGVPIERCLRLLAQLQHHTFRLQLQ